VSEDCSREPVAEAELCMIMAATALSLLQHPDGSIVNIGDGSRRSTAIAARVAAAIAPESLMVSTSSPEDVSRATGGRGGIHELAWMRTEIDRSAANAGVSVSTATNSLPSTASEWQGPISLLLIGTPDPEAATDCRHLVNQVKPGGFVIFNEDVASRKVVPRWFDEFLEARVIVRQTHVGKVVLACKMDRVSTA
jgi:hypothetical protein